jgi:hypothetical protein
MAFLFRTFINKNYLSPIIRSEWIIDDRIYGRWGKNTGRKIRRPVGTEVEGGKITNQAVRMAGEWWGKADLAEHKNILDFRFWILE